MKLRSLFSLVAVAAVLSSCGVNDLEDRLDKVENALGTNEPLKVDFHTTDQDAVDISKKTSFLFKSGGGYDEYIEDNQDDTYNVYIERFSDVEWYEGAWISFEYNAATKEVSNPSARIYFYDQYRNWINPVFSPESTGNTFSIKVNSFNPETGLVDVDVTAATDETAGNNEYEGKPMTCTFSFKGKLKVYID